MTKIFSLSSDQSLRKIPRKYMYLTFFFLLFLPVKEIKISNYFYLNLILLLYVNCKYLKVY